MRVSLRLLHVRTLYEVYPSGLKDHIEYWKYRKKSSGMSHPERTSCINPNQQLGQKKGKQNFGQYPIDIQFPVSKTTGDGNYPEISFVLVNNVVEGLMGVEPNAPELRLASVSRLPDAIADLSVKNINIKNSLFSLSHIGRKKSALTYQSGEKNFNWEIRFYGEHPVIKINGLAKPAQHKLLNGAKISCLEVEI